MCFESCCWSSFAAHSNRTCSADCNALSPSTGGAACFDDLASRRLQLGWTGTVPACPGPSSLILCRKTVSSSSDLCSRCRRYVDPDRKLDLDITYVADRVLAMSIPCVESAPYRFSPAFPEPLKGSESTEDRNPCLDVVISFASVWPDSVDSQSAPAGMTFPRWHASSHPGTTVISSTPETLSPNQKIVPEPSNLEPRM
eukprot:2925987-Rhodomonas_salina.1